MKITAVTQDQIIVIDSAVANIREIGGYVMENGEWAIHFDTDLATGQIEYIDSRTNQAIDQKAFDAHYQWLIDEHQRYQTHEAEQEKAAAAIAAKAAKTDTTEQA